jgi:hypothetical protein
MASNPLLNWYLSRRFPLHELRHESPRLRPRAFDLGDQRFRQSVGSRQHFKGCEHCVAVLDGTRNVIRLVGDGRVFDVPPGFGERLKMSLARKLGN